MIYVKNEKDSVSIEGDTIRVVKRSFLRSEKYEFDQSSVKEILLFTTDGGPVYDDMGLAVYVNDDDVIVVMSQHPCYESFLFEQLGGSFPLDHKKIIEASSCCVNNSFTLYKKSEQSV